jgi:hypothetical protein
LPAPQNPSSSKVEEELEEEEEEDFKEDEFSHTYASLSVCVLLLLPMYLCHTRFIFRQSFLDNYQKLILFVLHLF